MVENCSASSQDFKNELAQICGKLFLFSPFLVNVFCVPVQYRIVHH